MPERSKSSATAMWYQPRLTSPTTFVLGTRTSSKKTSLKEWPPARLTSGRTLMPGLRMSTMNIVRPLCLGASGSVRAASQPQSERCAPDVQIFWPLIR